MSWSIWKVFWAQILSHVQKRTVPKKDYPWRCQGVQREMCNKVLVWSHIVMASAPQSLHSEQVFSDGLTVWSLWWSLDKKYFSMCSHMTHQNSKQMVETKQLLEMVQVQTLWSLLNSVQKFQMKASTAVILAQDLP